MSATPECGADPRRRVRCVVPWVLVLGEADARLRRQKLTALKMSEDVGVADDAPITAARRLGCRLSRSREQAPVAVVRRQSAIPVRWSGGLAGAGRAEQHDVAVSNGSRREHRERDMCLVARL